MRASLTILYANILAGRQSTDCHQHPVWRCHGAARQQRNIHTQLAASQSGKFHFSLENCRTVRFVVLTE